MQRISIHDCEVATLGEIIQHKNPKAETFYTRDIDILDDVGNRYILILFSAEKDFLKIKKGKLFASEK